MKIFILSSTGTSLQSNNHRTEVTEDYPWYKICILRPASSVRWRAESVINLPSPSGLMVSHRHCRDTVSKEYTHIQTRDTLRHTQLSHKDTHIYIFVRDWLKVSRILISKMHSYLSKASPDLSIGVIRMQRLDGMLILHWKIFQKLRAQYYWEYLRFMSAFSWATERAKCLIVKVSPVSPLPHIDSLKCVHIHC